jgi:hypothetical protein
MQSCHFLSLCLNSLSLYLQNMNTVKYIALLAVLYFLPLTPCFSQNEFAFLATRERFIYEPTGFASQDGTYTLFFYHKGSRNIYTFDEQGEIVSQVITPFPAQLQQEEPLGIHETAEAYHYFFQSSTHQKSLEIISLGKQEASQTFSLLPLTTNRQDKFIQTLSLKGKLYFLLANRRQNSLIVVTPGEEKEMLRYEFKVSREVLREIRGADFSSISGDRETPFNSLKTAKAYLPEENKLVLIKELDSRKVTKEKGVTGILELNLQNEKASFRLVFGPDGINRRYQSNTLLHGNKLLKVSSNKNFFSLAFYSFPALEKQKDFFYTDTAEIALINRKFVQREGDKVPEYIERRETKRILKSLNKGTLAVKAINTEDATLQLQIGTFGFLQSGGAPMMMPMGGGSIGTPGGSVSIPVSYGFHSMPGSSSTFSHTFETSFSAHNLEPASGYLESLEEKEQLLIESLNIRRSDRLIHLPVSFRKSFIAHYNSKERMFTLYQLTTGDLFKASWNAPDSPDGF